MVSTLFVITLPDVNYIEFDGVFSLYVINEWQAHSSATCTSTCGSLDSWETYRSHKNYNPSRPCRGYVFNCHYMGQWVHICEQNKTSPYRYQWLWGSEIGAYGDSGSDCPGRLIKDTGSLSGFYSCDYCICECSESWAEVTQLRSFSLRRQITDVENNMVLSNIRFRQVENIVHLEIEQSPLLPGGQIDISNSSWVKLDKMIYSAEKSYGGFYNPDNNEWYLRGHDFQFYKRPGTYGIDIDDILAPKGYVMTGARLRHSYPREGEFHGGNDLCLNIHVSPFDFRTGKLTITEDNPSMWIAPYEQPIMPPEYSKSRYSIPVGGNADPWPLRVSDFTIKPNQEIDFQSSSYRHDVGRRTVPYLDNRPVVISNSAAMSGIGFVYRSQSDYIGVLALKLFTIDVSQYLNIEFSKDQYDFYNRLYRKKLVHEAKTL